MARGETSWEVIVAPPEITTRPTRFVVGTDNTTPSEDDTKLGTEVGREITLTFDIATAKKTQWILSLGSSHDYIGQTLKEIGVIGDYTEGGYMFYRGVISDLATVSTKEYLITIDVEYEDASTGNALMTDVGLNLLRDWLGGTDRTPPTHTAWGTGTSDPLASNTALGSQEQINAIDTQRKEHFKVIYETILTKSQANSKTITESGLFNKSSSGDLYGRMVFGGVEKNNMFQVQEISSIRVL